MPRQFQTRCVKIALTTEVHARLQKIKPPNYTYSRIIEELVDTIEGMVSVAPDEDPELVVSDKSPVEMKCKKCGYRWTTRTTLWYISCPNCRHSNRVFRNTGEVLCTI